MKKGSENCCKPTFRRRFYPLDERSLQAFNASSLEYFMCKNLLSLPKESCEQFVHNFKRFTIIEQIFMEVKLSSWQQSSLYSFDIMNCVLKWKKDDKTFCFMSKLTPLTYSRSSGKLWKKILVKKHSRASRTSETPLCINYCLREVMSTWKRVHEF